MHEQLTIDVVDNAKTISHDKLCELAAKYIKKTIRPKLSIVVSNVNLMYLQENPDIIGYNLSSDMVVVGEVKISRSDYLSDKKKNHRRYPGMAMGSHRYYICPQGMITVEEVGMYGLIYYLGNDKFETVKRSTKFGSRKHIVGDVLSLIGRDLHQEMYILKRLLVDQELYKKKKA